MRMLRRLALVGIVAAAAAIGAPSALAVSGAGYTTVNTATDGSNHCKNGNPGVNCNIYDGKQYVWLNGGPAAGSLGPDGSYFFAVLVPGGQPNPNDGGAKNLSDDFDAVANRTFTITNGEVSAYGGTHDFDSGSGGGAHPNHLPPFIRLMPYADTTNPGGVYIMAICSLANGYPVVPSACKYDAFKVKTGAGKVQSVLSGAKYLDMNKNGQRDAGEQGLANWSIHITGSDGTDNTIFTDANGDWSYTTGAHNSSSGTTTYSIEEIQQSGFAQTGNTVDQSIAAGGASVGLASFIYTVTVPNDAVSAVSQLLFGNIVDNPPVCTPPTLSPDGNVLSITAQDSDGIAQIIPVFTGNGVFSAPFTFGTTDPVLVTLTRNAPGTLGLTIDVVDIYGATTRCDPVASKLMGGPLGGKVQTFKGLHRSESKVTIYNGRPGLRSVRLVVNGRRFVVKLKPGQTRRINVAKAMRPGYRNAIKVYSYGRRGNRAMVLISN
jgi:hypothetical protein